MFSKFFITRPIFATVLAILMILAGVLTVKTLPVAQYPDITPPTIFVSASYPAPTPPPWPRQLVCLSRNRSTAWKA